MLEALACAQGLAAQLAGGAARLAPLLQAALPARAARLAERLREAVAAKPSLPLQVRVGPPCKYPSWQYCHGFPAGAALWRATAT